MTLADKKIEVLKYFDHVERYFLNDVKNLEEIKPNNEYGYCGIPQVLTLFSLMEIWGSLFSTDLKPTQEKKIEVFFSHFLSELDNWRPVLLRLVRHGVSHQFFPKKIAISKHTTTQQVQELFFKDEKDQVVLNVTYLTEKVRNALYKIKDALEDDNNIDNVYNKIRKTLDEDDQAYEALKGNFSGLKKYQLTYYGTVVPKIQK